jgi:hypothetical protein
VRLIATFASIIPPYILFNYKLFSFCYLFT